MGGAVGGARACLAAVAGAHGLGGLVRLRCFTERPEDVGAYGPLEDEAGQRRFEIEVVGRTKGGVLARIEGIGDRDQAEALAGTRLYVDRAALPGIEEPETFYHADLIGLRAEDAAGRPLGRITAVHDFGAGDLLELERPGPAEGARGGTLFVPFTRAAVPVIDPAGGRVVMELPMETGQPEGKPRRNADESG